MKSNFKTVRAIVKPMLIRVPKGDMCYSYDTGHICKYLDLSSAYVQCFLGYIPETSSKGERKPKECLELKSPI